MFRRLRVLLGMRTSCCGSRVELERAHEYLTTLGAPEGSAGRAMSVQERCEVLVLLGLSRPAPTYLQEARRIIVQADEARFRSNEEAAHALYLEAGNALRRLLDEGKVPLVSAEAAFLDAASSYLRARHYGEAILVLRDARGQAADQLLEECRDKLRNQVHWAGNPKTIPFRELSKRRVPRLSYHSGISDTQLADIEDGKLWVTPDGVEALTVLCRELSGSNNPLVV